MIVRIAAVSVALVAALVVPSFASAQERELHRGADAVAFLGDRLPEVAAEHRMSARRLADELRSSPTLAVDEEDNVIHLDVVPLETGDEFFEEEPEPAPEPFDPYTLHSDP